MKFFEPNLTAKESFAVLGALKDRHLSDGHIVGAFEDDYKSLGYKHVCAMNSGTSVLYSVLMALNLKPDDEVLVTPYTFIASIHVVLLAGATPVFVDIDRETYNMDIKDAARKRTSKTKAVIPVDVFGNCMDIELLRGFLPDVFILEDSIEAMGSWSNGIRSGMKADAAVFGYSPNKQMTTCEGGMLVTENEQVHDYVRRFRQHGFKTGDAQYVQMGQNFRMTDLHAALGRVQLARLPETQYAVMKTVQKLDDVGFKRSQRIDKECDPSFFVYVIELPENVSKTGYIKEMATRGVPVKPYFNDASQYKHLQKYGYCPVASTVGARTVALPTPYTMTIEEAELVRKAHNEVIFL